MALPDARKGQKVVLAVACPDANRSALKEHAKAAGVSEILLPQEVVAIDTVPLLASRKTNLTALQRLLEGPPSANAA